MKTLIGLRCGRLVIVAINGVVNRRMRVTARCDCGKQIDVLAQSLKSGNTKSCGCFKLDSIRKRQTTHGMSHSPEFWVWVAMNERCSNKKNRQYRRYGGRGISVCHRWKKSFSHFIADMGRRPSAKHELDRFPDNDGNYEPGNCRWATRKQQTRNTSRNRFVTVSGKRMCVRDAADHLGLNAGTIYVRIHRGRSPQEAISS